MTSLSNCHVHIAGGTNISLYKCVTVFCVWWYQIRVLPKIMPSDSKNLQRGATGTTAPGCD